MNLDMPVCYAKKLKLMISYETSLCIDLNITNTMFYKYLAFRINSK